MFTGIVQTTAQILASMPTEIGRRLTVQRGKLGVPVQHGDSICVSGVCLTAVEISDAQLGFDVIHETLMKTSIGALAVGGLVNLEPAVTPSQPMGGHFMQGHVDGLAVIEAIHTDDGEWRITLKPDTDATDLMNYIIPRGSVAIDGVSLTLARVNEDSFDVALIPATLEATTLGQRKVGDRVNIEADILAKTIVHQMQRIKGKAGQKPPVTKDLLREAGFWVMWMAEQDDNLDQLIQSLTAIIDLMRQEDDCHWLQGFEGFLLSAGQLKQGYTQDDLIGLYASISSVYGGMGSFNDYIPDKDGEIAPWANDFDLLRSLVYEQAFALRMHHR